MEKGQTRKGLIYRTQRTGVVLTLKKIDQEDILLMQDMVDRDRPEPPMVEVPFGLGGRTDPISEVYTSAADITDEIHAEYPGHRDLWAKWESAVQTYNLHAMNLQLNFCMEFGVTNPLPDDDPEVAKLRRVATGNRVTHTEEDIRSWWLRKQLSLDEYDKFITTVMGLSSPTEEGMAEAEERFRPDVEGTSGDGVPSEAQAAD